MSNVEKRGIPMKYVNYRPMQLTYHTMKIFEVILNKPDLVNQQELCCGCPWRDILRNMEFSSLAYFIMDQLNSSGMHFQNI